MLRYILWSSAARYQPPVCFRDSGCEVGRVDVPTDLGSAISKAKRWLIPSSRGPQDVAQHAAFGLLKKPGEKEKPEGKGSKKPSPKAIDEKQDKTSRCKYCDKPGHNILVCFKLIADQAAAKSDGPPNKKKTTSPFWMW